MAGISKKTRKNAKGVTITKYVITYRDIFGKQHTAGNYDTKREALKHINDYENIDTTNKNLTLGNILKIFLDRAKLKYATNTHETYNTYYNTYFLPISDIPYDKLNSLILQKLFDNIESKSPYIAHTCLKFAKAAVNYAIRHRKLKYNIFNEIEHIKMPKPNIEHLTLDELLHILEICKTKYLKYYAMLFTFVGSGMREGELIALEKNDFNYDEKTLTVNKQYTRYEFKEKTKTETSNRTIYIFDVLAEVLNEHIKTLPKDCKLMFPNGAGNYYNSSNLRERFWKPLLRSAGITKRVRLHDLRGSYTDLLLANRLSGKFAQNQLGHAKWETTYNVYAQNNKDTIIAAQDVINDLFIKKCEPNVSQIEKNADKKIIQFPKATVETGF